MRVAAVVVTLAGAVAHAGLARAWDVALDADTVLQVYEVRSPGTAAFMARRRVLQTLGLTYADVIGRARAHRRSPRLVAAVRLRLEQEMGETCLVARELCFRSTDAGSSASYQPLAVDTSLDAMLAYVEVSDLPLDTRARAGRQLAADAIGFARFDGASVRTEPAAWLAVEALFGALVRAATPGGTAAFEPTGAPRFSLGEIPASRAPYVREPTTTWIASAAAELGRTRIVRARAAYREMREDDGLLLARGALSLVSAPVDALRVDASAVWDFADPGIVDAHAGARLDLGRVSLDASAERHVPRFDPGSIWAYFDVAPVNDARVGARWQLSRKLTLGAALRARTAELPQDQSDRDFGVEASAETRLLGARVDVSAYVWGGALAPLAAVVVEASRPVHRHVRIEARASVWYFDDPLRVGMYGASFSEALGARLDLSRRTTLRLELEHAASRVVGQRVRGLAWLSVDAWQ